MPAATPISGIGAPSAAGFPATDCVRRACCAPIRAMGVTRPRIVSRRQSRPRVASRAARRRPHRRRLHGPQRGLRRSLTQVVAGSPPVRAVGGSRRASQPVTQFVAAGHRRWRGSHSSGPPDRGRVFDAPVGLPWPLVVLCRNSFPTLRRVHDARTEEAEEGRDQTRRTARVARRGAPREPARLQTGNGGRRRCGHGHPCACLPTSGDTARNLQCMRGCPSRGACRRAASGLRCRRDVEPERVG